MSLLLAFLGLFSCPVLLVAGISYGEETSRCENLLHLQEGICTNTVYNRTVRPNRFGHQLQAESYQELLQYKPLFNVKCSPYFQQFICTLYLPPCVSDPSKAGEVTLMQPCFELCQLARRNCEQLLITFGVPWPKPLDCTDLPRQMPGSLLSADGGVSSSEMLTLCIPPIEMPNADDVGFSNTFGNGSSGAAEQSGECPDPSMYAKPGTDYSLVKPAMGQTQQTEITDCGLSCSSGARLYTTSEQQRTLRLAMLGVALLTCASTLFTLLTFLMDVHRFRYPERPIIYMSLCYFVVSVVHIVVFCLGPTSVACTTFNIYDEPSLIPSLQAQTPPPIVRFPTTTHGVEMTELVTQGTRNEGCTVVFIFIYFFTLAASIWWVVLSLAWFLAAGLKWGHEAIEGIAHFFHIGAWALPILAVIAILAFGLVEGDPVSGLCRVAVFSPPLAPTLYRALHLTPQLLCLSVGGFLLLAGFASLFRIRTVMKADGARTDRLERLMARIGILGLLFTIPSAITAAASLFQLANQDAYMRMFFEHRCYNPSNVAEDGTCQTSTATEVHPDFTVLLLEHLCSIGVGLSTAFWVWSRKTFGAWARCLCCQCCSSTETRTTPGASARPMSPSGMTGPMGGMGGMVSAGFAGSSSTAGMTGAPLLGATAPQYSASGMPQAMPGMNNMGMYNPHQQPLLGGLPPNHPYLSS